MGHGKSYASSPGLGVREGLNDDFRANGSPQCLGIYSLWFLRFCNVLLKPANFATCVEDGGGAIPDPS